MRIARALVTGALLTALTACAGNVFPSGNTYISDQLAATENMATTGSAFDNALHSEYGWVARTEHNSSEPASDVGALIFNKRAAAAGSGQQVEPMNPAAVAVDDPEINDGYTRLNAALANGGAQSNPAKMAEAQAAFDCWVYANCNRQRGIEETCKARFLAAIAAFDGPPPAANYIVFFDWDSSAIRPDGAQVLNEVLNSANNMQGTKVYATGFTDSSGDATYNLGLSERRSVSVRDYLINGGLGASRVLIDWRGQADQRVPTPDGVREQENRRVEINLQ